MTSEPCRERVLDAATRLFAALGYDGTSTRMIAETAGLDVATVARHMGGKHDVYLAVMERAHLSERAALEAAVADMTPDAAGVLGLLDRYIDFCVAHPEIPSLWMHRWLSDAADVAHLEAVYVQPLMRMVTGAVGGLVGDGADVEYLAWTVVWCTHGFARGGVLDGAGRRRGIDDPHEVARFRAHLRGLVAPALRVR